MKIFPALANPFIQDPLVYNEERLFYKNEHNVTILVWDKKS